MQESTVKKNWKMLDGKKKTCSDTGSRTRGSAVKGLNVTATPYRITFLNLLQFLIILRTYTYQITLFKWWFLVWYTTTFSLEIRGKYLLTNHIILYNI